MSHARNRGYFIASFVWGKGYDRVLGTDAVVWSGDAKNNSAVSSNPATTSRVLTVGFQREGSHNTLNRFQRPQCGKGVRFWWLGSSSSGSKGVGDPVREIGDAKRVVLDASRYRPRGHGCSGPIYNKKLFMKKFKDGRP
jgi:hypothetical protein